MVKEIKVMTAAIAAGTDCNQPYKNRSRPVRVRQLKKVAAKHGIGGRIFKIAYQSCSLW